MRAMQWRKRRRESRESREATRRLRHFRVGEVERLREDAMKFNLSEAVTMASIRREVAAIVGNTPQGRIKMNLDRGRLISVISEQWRYELAGNQIKVVAVK